VVGLSATSQGNLQEIMEDVIAGSEEVLMLEFLSEYEFVSKDSPMNGKIKMLPKDSNIVDKIVKKSKKEYGSRPLICILEKDQQ
jgi:hypothetical protein